MRRPLLSVLSAGVLLAACDSLLRVQSPVLVDASTINTPEGVRQMVQGAVADFECAYASYVVAVGAVSDELISTAIAAVTPRTLDMRTDLTSGALFGCTPGPNNNLGFYTPLSTARYDADDVMRRIDTVMVGQPDRALQYAVAAAYAGYVYTYFGEGFCNAAFDNGPRKSPAEVLAIAEQRFTAAIDSATRARDDTTLAMARVGRARVYLDQGRPALAAQDAKLVPAGFVKYATYSTNALRRYNRVYHYNVTLATVGIDPVFRGLSLGGAPDPRVPVLDTGHPGSDGLTRLWIQSKYKSLNDPIRIASWNEAQLIIAEAEGGASAVTRINNVRTARGLALYSSTDSAAIASQVREERKRELFLEGARLNDMLRFNIPFNRSGTLMCFNLPRVEYDPNPNVDPS